MSRNEIIFELDALPPSDNHRNQFARFGARRGMIRTAEYWSWIFDVRALWKALKYPRFEGWVVLRYAVRFPDHRHRDANNLLKPICDALQTDTSHGFTGAWDDDMRVLGQLVSVKVDKKNPGLTMWIIPAHKSVVPDV